MLFTRPDGTPFHPGYFSQRFHLLIDRAGLPPIRLQDLRHGTASLAHSAGADLKTIQGLLGHSTIALTADVYANVLPAVQRTEAEATARLILGVADRPSERTGSKLVIPRPRRPRPNAAKVPAVNRRRAARGITVIRRRTRETRSPASGSV
ncbi:tyrosine-type recombinase/integrase [Dactylosporangium roseum]|uniref:tyrosine-type recombinase/integrase n=1 Tax=Dactylosporangium roseum TaxID=47989 RepID=UPI0021B2CE3F